jgi:hypothetical protein
MSRDFQIIQLPIDEDALKKLCSRQRNQLIGCMHGHNELTVLNRWVFAPVLAPSRRVVINPSGGLMPIEPLSTDPPILFEGMEPQGAPPALPLSNLCAATTARHGGGTTLNAPPLTAARAPLRPLPGSASTVIRRSMGCRPPKRRGEALDQRYRSASFANASAASGNS